MPEYVYLGKRVKDIRGKGLDTVKECKEIADAILEDYKNGEIEYKTAMSRLNLLELIASKNSKYSQYQEYECRKYVDKVREELQALREEEMF